jgi:UDPglucose 6-dehydrogenase
MKVGIVGMGYVGSAVFASYQGLADVKFHDPAKSDSVSLEELATWDPDVIFVCVPTPQKADGSCDVSITDTTLRRLHALNYQRLVICKSTAPAEQYGIWWVDMHYSLVHVPEFLKATNSIEDYINPHLIVLGGRPGECAEAFGIIARSHVKLSNTRVQVTDIKTAALFKYAANTFLAMKVVFANQLHDYCRANAGNWGQLSEMLSGDHRLGDTHWQVPGPDGSFGYGGSCFPKDISAIIHDAKKFNVDFTLLEQVQTINQQLRTETL